VTWRWPTASRRENPGASGRRVGHDGSVATWRIPIGLAAVGLVLTSCGDWNDKGITSYSLDGDSRVLVAGHCNEAGRVHVVDESATQVVLRLEVRGDHRGDCLECPAVELDDPVGDRAVIDATTDDPVPREQDVCGP